MILASAVSAFLAHYWDDIWKVLYGLAVGSIDLWGDNNWYEQVTEAINKWMTGADVDISKEAAEHSTEPRDLKRYIPNER